MLDILRQADPELLKIDCADGRVLVSNRLQGRIFASFGGELVHNLVKDLALNPDPVEFNNIGGNSLWPAPEGGDFAWNYPKGGSWYVQDGINRVQTATVEADDEKIVVEKEIELVNRKGNTVKLLFRRTVTPLAEEELPPESYGVKRTGYHSVDELIPLEKYSSKDVMLSAWSLEQLPGAEGISGFGRCAGPAADCANSDFYGDPGERLGYRGDLFRFELGGEKRLQIGIKAASKPMIIGSFDRQRGILVLRTTPPRNDGTYFNIADNDQASGPYGAADMFSIFNGSQELNFHELETIAPMVTDENGIIQPCRLESTTYICKGDVPELNCCLAEHFGIRL